MAPPGTPLSDFVDAGRRLEPKRIARIVLAIAEKVAPQHAKGVSGWSLRPEDVLLMRGDKVELRMPAGNARGGAAADQRNLAVTTFRLLTGREPGEASSLSDYRPELPGGVGRALAKGLARSAADRFPDILAFAEAFEGGFDEETILPPREDLAGDSGFVPVAGSHTAARIGARAKPPAGSPRARFLVMVVLLAALAAAWILRNRF